MNKTNVEIVRAPVLNLNQPWASAIVLGGKDIENRNYRTKYRGTVFVYATRKELQVNPGTLSTNGATIESGEVKIYGEIKVYEGSVGHRVIDRLISDYRSLKSLWNYSTLPLGHIIGTVDIVDVITESNSPWWIGPVGWKLENARPCKPIPWKGKQGFRHSKPETLEIEYL